MLPVLGFVVVTRNRVHKLSRCLESIQAQTYPNKLVVVVDNGSTDNTEAMLAQDYPEIMHLRQNANAGPCTARNLGVHSIQSELIIFLDDDAQLLAPDAAERTVTLLKNAPKIGGIAFTIVDDKGLVDRKCIPRRDKNRERASKNCTYFAGGGCAMRKSAFLKAGGYWEKFFIGCEELDLAYRILNVGYHFIYAKDIFVLHNESKKSRITDRDIYNYGRNRAWIAIRNLPLMYAVSTILMWWLRGLYLSVRHRTLRSGIRAIIHGVFDCGEALRTRNVLNKQAISLLKEHSGRLWY